MILPLLHSSQWLYHHKFPVLGRFINRIMGILCGADIPGYAQIHHSVSFSHEAHGVIINGASIIGEKCIIGAKVTLGNAFPNGGAPRLGKHVYVGVGAFLGGGYPSC